MSLPASYDPVPGCCIVLIAVGMFMAVPLLLTVLLLLLRSL